MSDWYNYCGRLVATKRLLFSFLVLLILLSITTHYYSESTNIFVIPDHIKAFIIGGNATASERSVKSILVWNSPHRIETAAFGNGGPELFIRHGCQVTACEVIVNQTERPLESYDAIIIQMHELWLSHLPDFERPTSTRLIFLSQESPTTTPINPADFKEYFNWTMTYKMDSDIKLLYGRVTPLKDEISTMKGRGMNYAANKTRPVVWMASHCGTHGQRETYVRELSKYIPVDGYGYCEPRGEGLNCPRNESHWLSESFCYDLLDAKYKFYLSFENCICKDYVTEKFFHILTHNMVPVVYGGSDYARIAPPHSYIDALEFTPESLAAYLHLLDSNDYLYNEYFWWKGRYSVEAGVEQMARHGFCDLCQKLHEEPQTTKIYKEMESFWQYANQCRTVTTWETSTVPTNQPINDAH